MSGQIGAAALGRLLNLNRATVSRYIAKGMPVSDRAAALRWIQANVVSELGGWHLRGKALGTGERAAEVMERPKPIERARQRYEALREQLTQLPEALLKADRSIEPWVVMAAIDVVDMTFGAIIIEIDPRLIDFNQAPLGQPNYKMLFEAAGRPCTSAELRAWKREAESFADAVAEILVESDTGRRKSVLALASGFAVALRALWSKQGSALSQANRKGDVQ